MKKKKIMILGASFSYIESINAAKAMGCEVLVADRNPKAIGFEYADKPLFTDITDIGGCLREAEKNNIDGIVAVNDFGVKTASVVSQKLGLPGLPLNIAEIATDKYLMREIWKDKNVPSVKYAKIKNVYELKNAIEDFGLPLIMKPCDSRGGGCRGVIYLDENTNPEKAFEFSNSFYRDDCILVEEFVSGLEHSVEVIVYNGKSHIIAVSDKIKSPLPYRVDETILYPTVEKDLRWEILRNTVEQSIEAIGMREGIAHVELTITKDGRAVLFELGARCGGGAPAPLVPFLSGVEEFQEAVRLSLGMAPQNLTPLHEKGCVIKFLYPKPGIVKNIQMPEKIKEIDGVLSFGLFINQGDIISPLNTCSDRAGMVITGKETREEAHILAKEIIDSIIVETESP